MLKKIQEIMNSDLPMLEKGELVKQTIKEYLNNESVENLINIVIRNRNSNEFNGLFLIALNELIDEKIAGLSEEDSVKIKGKLENKLYCNPFLAVAFVVYMPDKILKSSSCENSKKSFTVKR